jgi:1-acyl-sn-glycerol-3-phosphate acyltransferase
MVFIGKDDYFVRKGLKGRVMAAFFRGVGTIPVDRSGGSEAADALSTALRVLKEGRLFGIYPEGTRSPDGRLYRGKTGVARLAVESGAPVYPCALSGTAEIQPTGYRMPRKIMRPGIHFGEPLRYSEDADLRKATDEIVSAIQALSGQEYVDVYASSLKKG